MVRPGGEVRVVVPSGCSQPDIERFVERNVSWIARMVSLARRRPTQQLLPPVSRADFIRLKHRAFDLVKERIIHLNRLYGVSFESIRIGSAVSTWGSCNRNGALRFSYRILFLPPALQDYIIVHELCHRKEFNHGREFWNFVALTVPEYKMIRRQLRTYAG
jgi:predicted metal-dependent hydrolase